MLIWAAQEQNLDLSTRIMRMNGHALTWLVQHKVSMAASAFFMQHNDCEWWNGWHVFFHILETHPELDRQVCREAPAGYPQPVIPFSSTATLRVTSLIHFLHAAQGCQRLSEQAGVKYCQLFSLFNDCIDASVILRPTLGVWRWNSAPDLLSRGSSGAFGILGLDSFET